MSARGASGAVSGRAATFGRGAMLSPADCARLDELARSNDDALDDLLVGVSSVAILQYPFDGNVGNHMMVLAVRDYLRDRGIRAAYVAHTNNLELSDLRAAIDRNPILFIGGVTFSSVWPDHLEAKRIVSEAFPKNRIITLASTMLFTTKEDRLGARRAVGSHDDFVVIARDPTSAEAAEETFAGLVDVRVQHDSAFRLGPLHPYRHDAQQDIVWLRRGDAESAEFDGAGAQDVLTFDWPWLGTPGWRLPYVIGRAAGVATRLRSVHSQPAQVVSGLVAAAGYGAMSRAVLRRGIRELARGRVLVTDRMHPHILAILLGMPVVLLPDRFGKNRAVYEYSTKRFASVHWADDPETAIQIARALATTMGG